MAGRGQELGVLRGWLDQARDGAGRLVLCAGEAGIGKTRLAQELAGTALAAGTAVAWGRCAEDAPPYWPWRQILRSLGADADTVLSGERFRLLEAMVDTLRKAATPSGLLVILDDVHQADEPSLLVLRHLAGHLSDLPVLALATFRHQLAGELPAERLQLRGLPLDDLRDQLPQATSSEDLQRVHQVTGGNPLFVKEIARAMADGTWHADRPPRTVLHIVASRLDHVSADCRRLVQTAAIAGKEFSLAVVAAAMPMPLNDCLPLVDEAVAAGFLDHVGDELRFVHALTRDAVEASLTTASRSTLHRVVAESLEQLYADDLSEHLADIAHHWSELYGEGAVARRWLTLAADDAVRRVAYEEGVRLYRATLAIAPIPSEERCRVQTALGRAAYLAGDLSTCVTAAAEAAALATDPESRGEAALILEAVPDPAINATAKRLCEEALATGVTAPMRARLLAQRSQLAFYDGEQDRLDSLSSEALTLARSTGDDLALAEALRARQEARPGPAGRAERLDLATEMLELAQRTNSARSAMWGELWRLDALIESGRLAAAAEELPALRVATERVGGPVSAWHHDRVAACVAQARGRFAEAAELGRRGFDRMRRVEPAPANGAYFALQLALATHVGVSGEPVHEPFDPPPRFATMARLSRAYLLVCAERPEEAAASYRLAGPLEDWSLPAFFVMPGYVYAALACIGIERHDDLAVLLERLDPFRGEYAVGNGVAFLGPVELTLGRGAAALGRLDSAVADLTTAIRRADCAGAPAFAAEAQYHLAKVLHARNGPGDREQARSLAAAADRQARSLGMTAYLTTSSTALSSRETEVASLVAEGLTNRQIGERLVISERTAQNHVQHILTKLDFTSRSQIATWRTRSRR